MLTTRVCVLFSPSAAQGEILMQSQDARIGHNDERPQRNPTTTEELAMRRTGMAFQRTRMAADRTLMAVIRTSLSLIGFGFTIYQVFKRLREANVLHNSGAARNFGIALVFLGILMLLVGIGYHLEFMFGLRQQRGLLAKIGLVHAQSRFPVSMTLIVAVILLAIGVTAIIAITTGAGPLG
jgi:inner membrane protein YidH